MQDDREFAARPVRFRREPAGQITRRQGRDLFELLGQLAADRHHPLRTARRQLAGKRLDPVWRLEHDLGGGRARDLGQPARTLAAAGGQKADEREAGRARVAGRGEHRQRAARAGHRHDAVAGGAHLGDEGGPRVAHRWRAGIADIGDTLAAREPIDDGLGGAALVVLVHGDKRLDEPEVAQQRGAVARVLAGDRVDEREHVQRPQGDVGEVADRRRDDVERRSGILLAAGGQGRGLDELRSLQHWPRPP